MVLKMAGGTGFDVLADNLRSVGLREAEAGGRRQQGGADLIASTDPTITPELQYVVLLADQSLVVSSDSSEYAGSTAGVAAGGADSFASVAGVPDLADRMGDPANAMVWGKDFACTDLAMSGADDNDQARAEARVELLGGGHSTLRARNGDAARPHAPRGRTLRELRTGAEEPSAPCQAGRR